MATVKKVMHNGQGYNPNRTIHKNGNNYNAVKIMNNGTEYGFGSSEVINNSLLANNVEAEHIIDNDEVNNNIVPPETIDDDGTSTV